LDARPKTEATLTIQARLLNTAGQQALSQGQSELALEQWKKATIAYGQVDDLTGQIGSQINQAIALQSLGFYRRSLQQLDRIQVELDNQPAALQAIGLRQLGVAYRRIGHLAEAQRQLEMSLQIAPHPATRLSLAHLLRSRQQDEAALQQYRQVGQAASPALRLQAQLSQLPLLLATAPDTARTVASTVEIQLTTAEPSRAVVFARVNLAVALEQLADREGAAQQLRLAIQQSRKLQDIRAESFALGGLGALYQQAGQWSDAQAVTQMALALAQQLNAQDLTARWQHQLGQLAAQQGDTEVAIAAYQEAVGSLQALRQDLATVSTDVQFSFTQTVEPVYRELIQLLLTPAQGASPSQERLTAAREVLEGLKLAELDNFFRQACLTAAPKTIDTLDAAAAIIYPIILPERLAVIVARPQHPLMYYETPVTGAEVVAQVDQLRLYLNPIFLDETRLQLSKELYRWLLEPVDAVLKQAGVKTLVFVPDGPLNNIPMAALHDGQHYLIESYSIAIAPGLELIDPQQLARRDVGVLAAGLSTARLNFSPLPEVETELSLIRQETNARLLLNRAFTRQRVSEQVRNSRLPILHLATHGQFGATPEETFLVAWDGLIDIETLSALIESRLNDATPIELLILSACQTASGDERTALGLSGMAVRSGARSTVGTLWQVGDRSTAMAMAQFYKGLTRSTQPKVEALRQAQLSLLNTPEFAHPFYWSPYVMVGNWL
ncbi:MAG: CHAT domain-containing protein, partial [Elainellaceae cyanobacterium]